MNNLVQNGADLGATGGAQDWTPLHAAAGYGNVDAVEFLVSHFKVSVDLRDKFSKTPLHIAAENGELDVLLFLIDRGANINTTDENGWTALHMASEEGHIKCMRLLIRFGANIEAKTVEDYTPIHIASKEKIDFTLLIFTSISWNSLIFK